MGIKGDLLVNVNLKYSKYVIKDFSKLSNGRKSYITKRADKKNLNVSDYLKSKYGVVNEG